MERKQVPFSELTPLLEEFIEAGKSVEFTPTGASMEPLLHGRRSAVRLARAEEIRRGDIVLYRRRPDRYVLHRVIACGEDGTFTMCGDGQWGPERGIQRKQIIAVVTDFSRNGEKWTACTQRLYGVYWRVWLWLRPLRRLVFGGSRRIVRMLRKKCR